MLAAYRNAFLSAIPCHGTLAAYRGNRTAKVLAEADQQIVVFNPVWFRKLISQRELGFFRRRRLDIAPAVGNTMDMRVYANPRLAVAKGDDQVRSLSADAFELEKFVDVIRDFARIIAHHNLANIADHFRLGPIEAHRID